MVNNKNNMNYKDLTKEELLEILEAHFYAHKKLEENHNFPEDYVFKFIIPSNSEKITEILRIYDGMKYTLSNRDSKNGKYTSLTINAFVLDADQVIALYKNVAKLEGVMML